MPKDSIAFLKCSRDTFSKETIRWLLEFQNPDIIHATNGGEIKILGIKVDGYDETTNTIYQYHGCYWHGCPKCFDPTYLNTMKRMEMHELYEKTVSYSQYFRAEGYTVIEIWGCQYKKNKNIKLDNPIITPLNPRDALYGGRTEVFKTLVETGVIMSYIDICSLYPSVQFSDPFPVGHHTTIINPESYDPNWFGVVKCKILPPRNLYMPVLPYKTDKLLFSLCYACSVAKKKPLNCQHTADKRAFVGTWLTPEINKAIEKGYKIIEIYEVHKFERRSTDLFKSYIKKYLKIKLEASGCDPEELDKYIEDALKIDIKLDVITKNPGLKALAKLCLNTLWGKFGQRSNMTRTEIVTDYRTFIKIMLNEKLESDYEALSDEVMQVRYHYKDIFVENAGSTNVYIAAFTTCHARLRLYEQLENLGSIVVYCDTDSVVYTGEKSDAIKLGHMPGQWEDELAPEECITKFVAIGPKSYAYETNTYKNVLKFKGFTSRFCHLDKLNYDTMRGMVWNNDQIQIEEN
jgi:hypothetical protein